MTVTVVTRTKTTSELAARVAARVGARVMASSCGEPKNHGCYCCSCHYCYCHCWYCYCLFLVKKTKNNIAACCLSLLWRSKLWRTVVCCCLGPKTTMFVIVVCLSLFVILVCYLLSLFVIVVCHCHAACCLSLLFVVVVVVVVVVIVVCCLSLLFVIVVCHCCLSLLFVVGCQKDQKQHCCLLLVCCLFCCQWHCFLFVIDGLFQQPENFLGSRGYLLCPSCGCSSSSSKITTAIRTTATLATSRNITKY